MVGRCRHRPLHGGKAGIKSEIPKQFVAQGRRGIASLRRYVVVQRDKMSEDFSKLRPDVCVLWIFAVEYSLYLLPYFNYFEFYSKIICFNKGVAVVIFVFCPH